MAGVTAGPTGSIVNGSVRVQFGSSDGLVVAVEAGDAIVIPAGVSHCNKGASDDLVVVGAYPGEREPDMKRCGSDEIGDAARKQVRAVPVPKADPLFGKDGPLVRSWRRGTAR